MIRKTLFLLGLLCGSAFAQFTSVTATVTDPLGNPYAGCRGNTDIVMPASLGSQLATLGGVQFQDSVPIVCDSTGTFTVRLPDSCQVKPGGTSWQFTIYNPNVATATFTFTSGACGGSNVVTGSSVTLSAAISAVSASQGPVADFTVAAKNFSGQTANIGSTAVYTVPSTGAGTYEIQCYVVVTTAGTTSTMPACQTTFTDNDSGQTSAAAPITATSTANTVGTNSSTQGVGAGNVVIQAKAGTAINVQTASYASTGTAMQFALHFKVIFDGP